MGSYWSLGSMDLETGELLRSLDSVTGPIDSLEAVYALVGERARGWRNSRWESQR